MYGQVNNPMLKGFLSYQERVEMRERDRQSRNQIARLANRDVFLEQTSGAHFEQPVKIDSSKNQQITNILGEFDRVAPNMRSEKSQSNLVGAYAMPCTPAPVHIDHDHLFAAPTAPSAAQSNFPTSTPAPHAPHQPHACAVTGSSFATFRHPYSDASLCQDNGSVDCRLPTVSSSSNFVKPLACPTFKSHTKGRDPVLKCERPRHPHGAVDDASHVHSILQEMRRPLPVMLTPIKQNFSPVQSPAVDCHNIANDKNSANYLNFDSTTEWICKNNSVDLNSATMKCTSLNTAADPSLHNDLSLSSDEDEETMDEAAISNGHRDNNTVLSGPSASDAKQLSAAHTAHAIPSDLQRDLTASLHFISPLSSPTLHPLKTVDTCALETATCQPVFGTSAAAAAAAVTTSPAAVNTALQSSRFIKRAGSSASESVDGSDVSESDDSDSGSECGSDTNNSNRFATQHSPPDENPGSRWSLLNIINNKDTPVAACTRVSETIANTTKVPRKEPQSVVDNLSHGISSGVVATVNSHEISITQSPSACKTSLSNLSKNLESSYQRLDGDHVFDTSSSIISSHPLNHIGGGKRPKPRLSASDEPIDASLQLKYSHDTVVPSAGTKSYTSKTSTKPSAAKRARLSPSPETLAEEPPKLADVAANDANKRATFNRLFSHRCHRKTPSASSTPLVSTHSSSPMNSTSSMSTRTQQPIPSIVCRIDKSRLVSPEPPLTRVIESSASGSHKRRRHNKSGVTSHDARAQRVQSAAECRDNGTVQPSTTLGYKCSLSEPPVVHTDTPSCALTHHSSSSVTVCDPFPPTSHVQTSFSCLSTVSTQQQSQSQRLSTPCVPRISSGINEQVESPSTREADSSTNPNVLLNYDSDIPAALYTNQPFPIPANTFSEARSNSSLYFDNQEDVFERDQNQYLKQARRLKRAADNENDLTLRVIRYTQAVLYFLLTALSMEKDPNDSDSIITMLNDTLKLIKDMMRFTSASYQKHGVRPSHIDHKLQCLLLRCQGLIYLRMYKLKEVEYKRSQREIFQHKDSLIDSGDSVIVPTHLLHKMYENNNTQTHLQAWLEYWEQADELIQRARDNAEFFSSIDRTMGGLSATSTLLDLVYYIRETTRRLQDMHHDVGLT